MLKIAILVGLTKSRNASSCLECIRGECDHICGICGSAWIWWSMANQSGLLLVFAKCASIVTALSIYQAFTQLSTT